METSLETAIDQFSEWIASRIVMSPDQRALRETLIPILLNVPAIKRHRSLDRLEFAVWCLKFEVPSERGILIDRFDAEIVTDRRLVNEFALEDGKDDRH